MGRPVAIAPADAIPEHESWFPYVAQGGVLCLRDEAWMDPLHYPDRRRCVSNWHLISQAGAWRAIAIKAMRMLEELMRGDAVYELLHQFFGNVWNLSDPGAVDARLVEAARFVPIRPSSRPACARLQVIGLFGPEARGSARRGDPDGRPTAKLELPTIENDWALEVTGWGEYVIRDARGQDPIRHPDPLERLVAAHGAVQWKRMRQALVVVGLHLLEPRERTEEKDAALANHCLELAYGCNPLELRR